MADLVLLDAESVEKLFCISAKRWNVERNVLRAVAEVESSMDQRAYRFEPRFWDTYLKNNPRWRDRDPKEVSASYGLMQIMYTTAAQLGFDGPGEELYNPAFNIELGARLLADLYQKIQPADYYKSWPVEIVLARYNGGSGGNPNKETGALRNYQYTRKVLAAYWRIRAKGNGCQDK
jgi:soluble lytic murein transglycosylase-like protein